MRSGEGREFVFQTGAFYNLDFGTATSSVSVSEYSGSLTDSESRPVRLWEEPASTLRFVGANRRREMADKNQSCQSPISTSCPLTTPSVLVLDHICCVLFCPQLSVQTAQALLVVVSPAPSALSSSSDSSLRTHLISSFITAKTIQHFPQSTTNPNRFSLHGRCFLAPRPKTHLTKKNTKIESPWLGSGTSPVIDISQCRLSLSTRVEDIREACHGSYRGVRAGHSVRLFVSAIWSLFAVFGDQEAPWGETVG